MTYDVAVEALRSGVCSDCEKGAIHVCPFLVRDIVRAVHLVPDVEDVHHEVARLVEDERAKQVHAIVDAMLEQRPVFIWSKLGHWMQTVVLEVRRSGTVALASDRPGLILTTEPGEVHLTDPVPFGTRRSAQCSEP